MSFTIEFFLKVTIKKKRVCHFLLSRWPADKSDGIGTMSRISQVMVCDITGGPISNITNPTQENVRNYFNAPMTKCINEIPVNRRQRSLIYLGK